MSNSTNATTCPFCSKTFRQAGPFDKHLRLAHPDHAAEFYKIQTSRQRSLITLDDSQEIDTIGFQLEDTDDFPSHLLPAEETDDELCHDSDAESECQNIDDDLEESQPTRHELLQNSGTPTGSVPGEMDRIRDLIRNPWYPFRNASEFKLARFFVEANIPWERIEGFLKAGLAPAGVFFTSAFTLRTLLNNMDNTLGPESWRQGSVVFSGTDVPFYYRNPIDCIKYLLRQRAYRSDLVFSPERFYEGDERQYSELHTANWWWDTQETLPEGSTLVPVICASDTTHLTNFSGDKKAWPIYITIGNIRSATRNKPTAMALILLALLPVPPKLKDSRSSNVSAENNDIIHRVLSVVLEGLIKAGEDGVTLDCADGQRRHCYPVLCAWIADHMEHVLLQNLKNNSCPRCEVPQEELGNPPAALGTSETYPVRNHRRYQQLAKKYHDTGEVRHIEVLAEKGIKSLFNAFWALPRVNPSELPKPDLLHTIYLGILKHLMEWVQDFLKKHNRLDRFDEAWSSMGAYPGFTVPKKAYRQVSQWQGKEMRNLGKIVLAAFTAALQAPTEAQRHPFQAATRCVAALIDFHLLAQYKTHTETTLQYMHDSLLAFHKEKVIFQEFRVGKRAQKEVEKSVAELISAQSEEILARKRSGESAAKRRRVTIRQQEELIAVREEEAVGKAHFNFIKMHLLEHFGSTVQQFGSIPLFSTDISELAHKTQIKESYRRSNKNNPATQILDNYSRIHAFNMHILNLKSTVEMAPTTLLKDVENGGIREVLGMEIDARDSVTSSPHCELPRRVLRSPVEGIQSVHDIGEILGIPDLATCILKYAKNSGLTGPKGLPDNVESLSKCLAHRFKMLQVPVPAFQDPDSHVNHNLRCTGSEGFHGKAARNDPVWVNVEEGVTKTGDLGGRLPAFLRGLLKVRAGSGHTFRIAVVEVLWPLNGGKSNSADTLVRVHRKVYKTATGGIWVTNIRSIMGMAHLVAYGDSRWLVNNRIDLKTWNDVYMGLEGAI